MVDEPTRVQIPVEPKVWTLRIRNDRRQHRGRPEAATIQRWINRWRDRTRDTEAGPVSLDLAELDDDFVRNQQHLRIRIPRLVRGQDWGLPPIFHVNANVLEFVAVGGRVFDRVTAIENSLMALDREDSSQLP